MGNLISRARRRDDLIPFVTRGDIETGSETNCDVLSERLERLYDEEIRFKRSPEEVKDITEAVQALVGRIIREVGNIDTRFTCSTIHPVGSMAEGTRIIEPDEFDFLVVIDDLSFSDDITWSRPKHDDSSGSVHIKIDRSHRGIWEDLTSKNEELKSTTKYIIDKGLKQAFHKVVSQAVVAVMERDDAIVKATGELTISKSKVKRNGVACTLDDCFLWSSTETSSDFPTSLPISVDITASIQTTFEKSGIERSDVAEEELFNKLKNRDIVMAVPCGDWECGEGKCFKYSVTTLELGIMRTKMLDHLRCYMILKYLLCGACKCERPCLHLPEGSSSYAIKNVLFKHVETCTNSSLGPCVCGIVTLTANLTKNDHQPHTFSMTLYFGSRLPEYSVKVSHRIGLNGEHSWFLADPFHQAANQQIKQTLDRISNTPMEHRDRSLDYTLPVLQRFATFKKYDFVLVFTLYIIHWLAVYSYTCVPMLVLMSLKLSFSPWQVLVTLVLLLLLQTLLMWFLYSLLKTLTFRLQLFLPYILLFVFLLLVILSHCLFEPDELLFWVLLTPAWMFAMTFCHAMTIAMSQTPWLLLKPRLSLRAWLLLRGLVVPLGWPVLLLPLAAITIIRYIRD